GQRGAEEPGNLHVERLRIPVDELHRIAPHPLRRIGPPEQLLQRRLHDGGALPDHRPSSSARCPSSGMISLSQASRTAAGLPGMAKTNRPLASCPARARESIAALPISA